MRPARGGDRSDGALRPDLVPGLNTSDPGGVGPLGCRGSPNSGLLIRGFGRWYGFTGYLGANAPLFGFDSKGRKVPLKRLTFQQPLPSDGAADTFASFGTAWMPERSTVSTGSIHRTRRHVDARSNSIEDAFDFSKPARAYR
jgi:hypothetical protein